ncbi:MAG: type II toxin-antitoxin system VapC family toxin [Acidimicrobiia bacterium]
MNAEGVWYVDSSAIVKLVASEPESEALTRFLKPRESLVSSGLATTEVLRAVMALGEKFIDRAHEVLRRIELVRIGNEVLKSAGLLQPWTLRSLDGIHLATAALFGDTLSGLVTYDGRMQQAASSFGWNVQAPT